jgi:hypothetical protein
LERGTSLPAARIAAITKSVNAAEKANVGARHAAPGLLTSQLSADARTTNKSARVRPLTGVVKALGK